MNWNIQISGVTSDSREVKQGFAYVAVKGTQHDGHCFLLEAAASGAVALVGELPAPSGLPSGARYFQVADSRAALAEIAATFYRDPSRSMKVVGVTGTSGKTTTAYLLESIFRASGHQVGLIGTVNCRYSVNGKETVLASTHTTPGAVELQALLAKMRDAGCTAVVMEVSSHALRQSRVHAIGFDGMAFTNLSPEHMDFHPDMDHYYESKRLLFTDVAEFSRKLGKSPAMVVNADDSYGVKLLGELNVVGYGLNRGKHLGATLRSDLRGVRGKIGPVEIESPLIGKFNAYNILAAVALSIELGLPADRIACGLRDLAGVPGRLQAIPNRQGIHVLVDYAHKPDALEKVLRTLRDSAHGGRLITVFGCGGDRDKTKRPVMGRLALELSDRVIITSDNPRTEDPAQILIEVESGAKAVDPPGHRYGIEPDRKRAIFAAIQQAKAGDIVLIAGKGHEDYQILGKTRIHFDDREVAAEALSRLPEKV